MHAPYPQFKIRKKKLGVYPYVSVVFSITLALFVMGIFGTLMIYSKELEKVVRENVKIQVFLQHDLSHIEQLKIQRMLASKYFTAKDVTKKDIVQFISKEDAAKQFTQETGENFQQLLGENPLRDALLVRIAKPYHDHESMMKIKKDVEKINGVFQVYYVESVVDSIHKNLTKIGFSFLGVSVLLFLTVVLLIHNTIKIALFSQRFLIRSMQLVGAKRGFIQRPFLYRALLHGFVSGMIASLLLSALIRFGNQKIEDLQLIYNQQELILLFLVLLVLGMTVAFVSAFRAINKYLKLSLDELH